MRENHSHSRGVRATMGDRQVIAYFSTLTKAQGAARKITSDVSAVEVAEVSGQQARQALAKADAGISIVKIGRPAWLGLVLGIILGTLWGVLAFSGRVPIPGIIAPTLFPVSLPQP